LHSNCICWSQNHFISFTALISIFIFHPEFWKLWITSLLVWCGSSARGDVTSRKTCCRLFHLVSQLYYSITCWNVILLHQYFVFQTLILNKNSMIFPL